MKIGFIDPNMALRGTTIAIYDYASYNEIYLKNTSFIIAAKFIDKPDNIMGVHHKFINRFGDRFLYYENIQDIQQIINKYKIEIIYIIKYGYIDEFHNFKNCKTIIHSVFNTREPHGDYYCSISPWLTKSQNTNIPVLPHIVTNYNVSKEEIEDYKIQLGIPKNAYVIGRYGGIDTFDILFVQKVVEKLSNDKDNNLFFIFMNTREFECNKNKCIFLPSSANEKEKSKYIQVCNAFLHARALGETFGLAIGEFAIENKQIISYINYSNDYAKNHIEFLRDSIHLYRNPEELVFILLNIQNMEKDMTYNNEYLNCTPKNVMDIFQKIIYKIQKPKILDCFIES